MNPKKTTPSFLWRSGLVFGMVAGAVLIFSFSCSRPKKSAPPQAAEQPSGPQINSLTGQEIADGWILLFDGHSFEGWRGIGITGIPEGHWVIENGAIKKVAAGEVPRQADGQPTQGGDLMTVATFEDFDLRLEWKISPGGNSGIKYNVSEEISIAIPPPQAAIGFEYQILDDAGHPDAANGPNRRTGALYDILGPAGAAPNPVGTFNQARIIFRGGHGEHWLNGTKVLEFDLGTTEMNDLLRASKFRDIADFGIKRRGHIVLQDHGDTVWFRNIKIRELPPE